MPRVSVHPIDYDYRILSGCPITQQRQCMISRHRRLIPAGLAIVVIHAGFILAAARITKAPLFLAAAASQANIGGVASAPVVAEAYQPHLASVGLLLAVLGNIVGTYMGILAGQLCRMLN